MPTTSLDSFPLNPSPTFYLPARADGGARSRGPMSKIVFSIQLGRTVSAETWDRFLERVVAQSRTPADVIREFIERYAAGEKP